MRQQFTVPQFIDVEDKIIGPITTRQFIIMVVGGLLIFIWYKAFGFWWFVGSTLFTILSIALLGFVKINGQPFHYFLINIIETIKRPSLRVWNKEINLKEIRQRLKSQKAVLLVSSAPIPVKKYTSSRLAELSLIVDTGGAYEGEPLVEAKKKSKSKTNS